MLNLPLKKFYRSDFVRREDGDVAIEAMIILPMLFFVFLSMFSIFDAFRQYSIGQKAAYTVGDMISRETTPINENYIDGAKEVFDFLARASAGSALRVTSVRWNAETEEYTRDWSKTRGWVPPLTNNDVKHWDDRLPVMPDNDSVVIVETWVKYDPPFKTGLENKELRNFIFTRPRYADRVKFQS